MPKTILVGKIYGYVVCIIAIIISLIAIGNIVNALINLSDPVHVQVMGPNSYDVSSLNAFKTSYLQYQSEGTKVNTTPTELSESELQLRYEAARESHIASVKLESRRSITIWSILIVTSILLFFTHWRWLKRQ